MLGNYVIDVHAGSNLPQKVASGFTNVFSNMVGASYDPIAYLGHKLVNGTNHAVLCKQTLVVDTDVTSVSLVVLNEKPGDMDGSKFAIVSIEPIVTSGGPIGGLNISPTVDIPSEALDVFNKHFGGFLGAKNRPFALLATQAAIRGGAYVFAVESNMITSPDSMVANTKSINVVKVYGEFSEIETTEVLRGTSDAASGPLGYSFTWLKNSVWP